MLAATATVPFSFEGLCRREGEGDNVGSTDGRTDGQTGPPSRRAHNGGQMATGGGPGQGGNDNVLVKAKKHTKFPIPTTLLGASFCRNWGRNEKSG
jgi:hypothetical protein